MPVLPAGRKPDDIAGPDLLDGSAFPLNPAAPSRYNQRLPERMSMPSSACTRLKSHAGTAHACRIRCLKQWIDSYGAIKPRRRSLRGRLRASSFDFHLLNSLNQTTFSGINCRKAAHSQNVLVRTFLEDVFHNR